VKTPPALPCNATQRLAARIAAPRSAHRSASPRASQRRAARVEAASLRELAFRPPAQAKQSKASGCAAVVVGCTAVMIGGGASALSSIGYDIEGESKLNQLDMYSPCPPPPPKPDTSIYQ
jgi:hypothetical protein